jgi:D-alanyl-lipoteichoic acid acyltransferase DltB (MBOAT superfamily)
VSVSYVADVYKGKIAAEKHLGRFALFISFFPTVLSGPIERANNLLAQINRPSPFDYDLAVYGLRDLLIGFFKKMVVADSLGVFVDSVYGSVHSYSGFTLVIIALFYTVQIYCDFSGYSSIAVGIAKLFGIRLRKNFGYPYFATSIKAFWGEWHISLSTWFRDYVYIPLGGNRVGKLRHKLNLMITFLVSGLWHGASWNFVIWGGIHGFVQVVESGFSRKDKSGSRILGFVKWLFVMLIVTVAWVFFRAQTLGDAAYVFAHCFEGIGDIKSYVAGGVGALPVGMLDVALAVVPAVLLFALELLCKGKPFAEAVDSVNKPMRWVIYVLLVLMIVFLTPVINASTFLYFQF